MSEIEPIDQLDERSEQLDEKERILENRREADKTEKVYIIRDEDLVNRVKDKYARESLKSITWGKLFSRTSTWINIIIFILVTIALILVYYFNRNKFVGLNIPTLVSNSYVNGIVLFVFYLLYFIGFIGVLWVINKFSKPSKIIHILLYSLIMLIQIITLIFAFMAFSFQTCFWLSVVDLVLILIQLIYMAYNIGGYYFIITIPILLIQAVLVYAFYNLWRNN